MSQFQSLMIDGYNVLFQTPLMVAGQGNRLHEFSRKRLVAFVELTVQAESLSETVIVFDAKTSRTAEPIIEDQPSGLKVVFASNYAEADQYIEDWIIRHPKPKSALVISSDGKIRSTARSYAAQTMDSKDWYLRSLTKIPVVDQKWIQTGRLPELPTIQKHMALGQSDKKPIRSHLEDQHRARRNLTADDLARFQHFHDDE